MVLINEMLARVRPENLSCKLEKGPIMEEQYNKALPEMEQNGVIKEVPTDKMASMYPIYYMPHRAVVRKCCTTTKVRPVAYLMLLPPVIMVSVPSFAFRTISGTPLHSGQFPAHPKTLMWH